jgi:hypothetical protein
MAALVVFALALVSAPLGYARRPEKIRCCTGAFGSGYVNLAGVIRAESSSRKIISDAFLSGRIDECLAVTGN